MHLFNPENYYLAQVNTAKVRFPLDDPRMADFVAQIRSVNAVADADPGFVWRLRGEGAEDATDIRPFEDERILITLTVWKSVEALSNYVYRSAHAGVMRDRKQWFEKSDQPILAMWWIPAGHLPTVAEAIERLEHLRSHGSTPYAFPFNKPFSARDAIEFESPTPVLI
jgi:heme-degrading monooxygenase HmoA